MFKLLLEKKFRTTLLGFPYDSHRTKINYFFMVCHLQTMIENLIYIYFGDTTFFQSDSRVVNSFG